MDGSTPTIRELWRTTGDVLADRVVARWICEVAVALDGDEFLAALDEPATARMVAHLDVMVARVRAGEPLQYVLGWWGFRHLDLAIDRRVLIPRPETEIVAEHAIGQARRWHDRYGAVRCADLGTGSGAIGLSLAVELPLEGTEVWITDVSPDALDVATANLAGIGRAARNVRTAAGSWFDPIPADIRFAVVVANPPYVADASPDLEPAVRAWEPATALFGGPDGLDPIRLIVAAAPSRLEPGGSLVLEIGADQGAAVGELLRRAGFDDVEVLADLAGRDRVAVGRIPSH
jgi:release factor glutamine methyltransferase